MKLTWGKKICCPKCGAPFYSMQRTSLICPCCGQQFEISELTSRKGVRVARDELVEYDEKVAFAGFDQMEEESDLELGDDNDVLSDEKEVVSDVKLANEIGG